MAMPTTEQVLHAMASAMFNEAYSRRRADAYAKWDFWVRVISAATGTGAVVMWASKLTGGWATVWGILMVIAALCSAIGATARFAESARHWSDLASRWSGVTANWQLLDQGLVPDAERERTYVRVMEAMGQLQQADTTSRADKLAVTVQGDVRRQLADRFA